MKTNLTLITALGAVILTGCAEMMDNRLDRLSTSDQLSLTTDSSGNFDTGDSNGCGFTTPNIQIIDDLMLTGQDHYVACYSGGSSAGVWVAGESYYSQSICAFPVDISNSGGQDEDYQFLEDSQGSGGVLYRCTLSSMSGVNINLGVNPGDTSFNALVIVPANYANAFVQWAVLGGPFEPPYSFGFLSN